MGGEATAWIFVPQSLYYSGTKVTHTEAGPRRTGSLACPAGQGQARLPVRRAKDRQGCLSYEGGSVRDSLSCRGNTRLNASEILPIALAHVPWAGGRCRRTQLCRRQDTLKAGLVSVMIQDRHRRTLGSID